ncbi:type II secretion system protein M [Teredinibacter waterburyi]|uniref:type II secretion system protein M n=1 Tax=Teredinibacter waterburyi TaxID=1500538 RepID=UPI00165F3456|nr:type II secretion system protein M [Teredinibacter waterburyi]
MNEIKEWWNQASSRDQIYLVALGLVLALYFLYAAILKPTYDMRNAQLRTNIAQTEALARVREYAAIWMSRDEANAGAAKKASIVEAVDESLRKHSLQLSGMQPSGNSDVRLRLDQVNFDNFLAWVNEVENAQRIEIKDLSIANGSNPGFVSVNVRLHRD